MKKFLRFASMGLGMTTAALAGADSFYGTNVVLSAPAAGESGTTAVSASSNAIVAWADGYEDYVPGTEVDDGWKTPQKALGRAEGTSFDVVVLGRGGRITMTFSGGISDGPGPDFVVFENGFDDFFLELAWVEVSSDGTNFVRFPNYSYTQDPVAGFGRLETRLIWGLASKYRQGFGDPFDLADLQRAYDAALAGNVDFSQAFATQLTNNLPLVDLHHVAYVRLVDVVGDGNALDCRGSVVYDPYPTSGSAGFDLDAVGVLHSDPSRSPIPYGDWALAHGVSSNGIGDADADGVSDLQEYAFGGDPNDPASAPRSTFALSALTNGEDCIELRYAMDHRATVDCRVETTDALTNETWNPAAPVERIESNDLERIYRTEILSLPGNVGFYRLRIESR